jgi:hypothetical protein
LTFPRAPPRVPSESFVGRGNDFHVEAGRELEIDPLIGSFVELGRITDTPVPATEMLHALVSQLNASLAKGTTT